jgi:hypothetical protein
MPSAKTVAQKPAGNFNPLSSFAQGWFWGGAEEPPMPSAAIAIRAHKRLLKGWQNRMEGSSGKTEGQWQYTAATQPPTGQISHALNRFTIQSFPSMPAFQRENRGEV